MSQITHKKAKLNLFFPQTPTTFIQNKMRVNYKIKAISNPIFELSRVNKSDPYNTIVMCDATHHFPY
jgi:hypothetical protein